MCAFENEREQRNDLRRQLKESDPTTFSRNVLPKERLKPAGRNHSNRHILESREGESFHYVNEEPKMQRFCSRLLKPFFPVADVVRMGRMYYSYEPRTKNIKQKINDSDITIDLALITYLVGDWDRTLDPPSNMIIEDDKALYFDFEYAFPFPSEYRTEQGMRLLRDALNTPHYKSVKRAFRKTSTMLKYWQSEHGRSQLETAFKQGGPRLKYQVKKWGPKGEDTTFDDFLEALLTRTKELHQVTSAKYEEWQKRKARVKRRKDRKN